MILDNNLMFEPTTGSAGAQVSSASTNIIDLQNARDMGASNNGEPDVLVQVVTTFTTGNGGTLNVQFQGSTDSVTWTTYAETSALAVGLLVAGNQLLRTSIPGVQPDVGALPRYLRLNYVVANAFTAGALTGGLVLDRQENRAYPSGFTVAN